MIDKIASERAGIVSEFISPRLSIIMQIMTGVGFSDTAAMQVLVDLRVLLQDWSGRCRVAIISN